MWPFVNTSYDPPTVSKSTLDDNGESNDTGNKIDSARESTASIKTPSPPGKTLTEALRRNPFRFASRSPDGTNGQGKTKNEEAKSLNADLAVLAELFPDVKLEVFREMLLRFDGDSRLLVCVEQLRKHKNLWAKGRMEVPPRDWDEKNVIPDIDRFRQPAYIKTVHRTLSDEFRGLSKSTVDAVLAEVNFSYARARPVLQVLHSKSWRVAIGNLFWRKSNKIDPSAVTGCRELDEELRTIFIDPARRKSQDERLLLDREYAIRLNTAEAEREKALFECQVCYDEFPVENVASCTSGEHLICLICMHKTVQEALFGQGWNKSVDINKGSLRCLADSECTSHIPQSTLHQVVLLNKSGPETWSEFEARLARHTVFSSNLQLIRCPFCPYAEVDRVHSPNTAGKDLQWRMRKPSRISPLPRIILIVLLPILLFTLIPLWLIDPRPFTNLFYNSLANSASQNRTSRFTCLNPKCRRKSCLKCSKAWHDPHTCHEPLITSLRTTVEAARTAAIKRTCPRCGTSFVKSSGCNKLVCVCGYAMCYLCRKNIGKVGPGAIGGGGYGFFAHPYAQQQNNDNMDAENPEAELGGYRHFCEHFRAIPGTACTQCNKCDLYLVENEDEIIRRAGMEAERLWRQKEGVVGVKGLDEALGKANGNRSVGFWNRLWTGDWEIQQGVDWLVSRVIIVTER